MTQDTRKDRRVKIVSLNVRYKSATVDEFIENHAYDVSRGGIFIKTANPFPPGTLLKFEIRLASDQAVIAGVGRIVWKRDAGASSSDRPAGMGVKFIKIDEPSKVVIDRLVNTKADAGRAFEIEANAKGPSERPVPRVSPSTRPATSQPASASPKVPGARSMSPAAGIASAAKGSASGAAVPPPRKATMIGVGSAPVPPAPSSSPGLSGLPSTVPPAARPSFPAAPSAPPRPGGGGGSPMFPKSRESDWPPKQEPTVMKQAAELLEEALREVGGSMEEIGTNPLFSGAGATSSAVVDELKAPLPSESEWRTADEPPPQTPAPEDAASAPPQESSSSKPSVAPRSTRETPTSVRPAPAVARASGQPAAKKKGGSGTAIFLFIAAAAAIGGVVMFRDQLLRSPAAPEPVAAPPPTTQAAATPTAIASASATPSAPLPPTIASGKSEPAPSASSPLPSSSAAGSVATVQKSAEVTNIAPPPALRPLRPVRPIPPPAAATMPADTNSGVAPPTEPTSATASTIAAPAAAASASPPPKTAPPQPVPRAKPAKPPADDNPY